MMEAREKLKMPMSLEQIITAHNVPFTVTDPWPKESGSVIHALTPAQIAQIAKLMDTYATDLVPLWLLAAHGCQECLFDFNAINPNNQLGHPETDTDIQKFLRTDYGFAQVDGRYMAGHHGMAGLSMAQMIAKSFDPVWAVQDMVLVDSANINWAKTLSPTIAGTLPTQRMEIALQAYNTGQTGTLEALRAGHPLPYGDEVWARAQLFKTQLGL